MQRVRISEVGLECRKSGKLLEWISCIKQSNKQRIRQGHRSTKHRRDENETRDTKIGLSSWRNLEKLYIFWRISENRNIVGHENFVFWRTEYGKVTILRILILLKQKWSVNLTSKRITHYTNLICFRYFGEFKEVLFKIELLK